MTDRQRMFDYLDGVVDGLNESRNDVADVLDKIRHEIERMRSKDEGRWIIDGTYLNIDYVLEVIDKYKAESEARNEV